MTKKEYKILVQLIIIGSLGALLFIFFQKLRTHPGTKDAVIILVPTNQKGIEKDTEVLLESFNYQIIQEEETGNGFDYKNSLNYAREHQNTHIAIIKPSWLESQLNLLSKTHKYTESVIKIRDFIRDLHYLKKGTYFLGTLSSGFLEVSGDLLVFIDNVQEIEYLDRTLKKNLELKKNYSLQLQEYPESFVYDFYKKNSDIPLLDLQVQSHFFGPELFQNFLWDGKAKFILTPWSLKDLFEHNPVNENLSFKTLSFFFPLESDLKKIIAFCYFANLYQTSNTNIFLKEKSLLLLNQLSFEQQRILKEYWPRSFHYLTSNLT